VGATLKYACCGQPHTCGLQLQWRDACKLQVHTKLWHRCGPPAHTQLLYTSGSDLEGAKRMEKGSRTGAVEQVGRHTRAGATLGAHKDSQALRGMIPSVVR
jgi:hypothetical protein